jgi:XTP/dITP diphosphohydrolase
MKRMMPDGVELLPRPQDLREIDETAPTLEGNAVIKAVEVANFCSQWALADDTGLEVDALHGAPGVHSARFASENATDSENRQLLLSKMAHEEIRSARFRTVVALVSSNGDMHFVTGVCEGRIAQSESGINGFGYDSVFIPSAGDGRTFAEMSDREKDALSHRGKAFSQLPELLARVFGLPTP